MDVDGREAAASLALYADILQCRGYADVATRLLGPVGEHIGATSGVFLQFLELGSSSSRIARNDYVGHSPQAAQAYIDERFHVDDPCVRPLLGCLQGGETPLSVALLSRIPGWRSTAYEAAFLKPFDVGDVLALAIPVVSAFETVMLCVGFHRRHEEPRFGAAEAGRLRALTPALQTVLTNIAYAESLALSATVAQAVATAADGTGVVVLDDDLAVRHANRQGLRDLGLLAAPGQSEMIVRSDVFGDLRERLLHLGGGRAQNFTLSPAGVEVEAREFRGPAGDPCYLVLTHERGSTDSFTHAARAVQLSAREAEVARLVCAGESNAGVAAALGIALRTVENHLRSVYAKAGVSTRTQLLARMMARA